MFALPVNQIARNHDVQEDSAKKEQIGLFTSGTLKMRRLGDAYNATIQPHGTFPVVNIGPVKDPNSRQIVRAAQQDRWSLPGPASFMVESTMSFQPQRNICFSMQDKDPTQKKGAASPNDSARTTKKQKEKSKETKPYYHILPLPGRRYLLFGKALGYVYHLDPVTRQQAKSTALPLLEDFAEANAANALAKYFVGLPPATDLPSLAENKFYYFVPPRNPRVQTKKFLVVTFWEDPQWNSLIHQQGGPNASDAASAESPASQDRGPIDMVFVGDPQSAFDPFCAYTNQIAPEGNILPADNFQTASTAHTEDDGAEFDRYMLSLDGNASVDQNENNEHFEVDPRDLEGEPLSNSDAVSESTSDNNQTPSESADSSDEDSQSHTRVHDEPDSEPLSPQPLGKKRKYEEKNIHDYYSHNSNQFGGNVPPLKRPKLHDDVDSGHIDQGITQMGHPMYTTYTDNSGSHDPLHGNPARNSFSGNPASQLPAGFNFPSDTPSLGDIDLFENYQEYFFKPVLPSDHEIAISFSATIQTP